MEMPLVFEAFGHAAERLMVICYHNDVASLEMLLNLINLNECLWDTLRGIKSFFFIICGVSRPALM